MKKACINCAYASEFYPSFMDYCDLDGHVILDADEYSCKNFYPLEQEDDDAKVNWINGSIKPPKAKVYYVIMECVKDFGDMRAGEIDICSAIWFGDFWDISGRKNKNFRILSWAEQLLPDIPKDLQGRVKRYFGQEVKNDGTISK